MLYLPSPVVDYIHNLTVENRSPAYLFVTKDGRLSRWGGKLSLYGFTNLQQAESVEEQVLFLAGLLPLDGYPIILPCIEMQSGIFADVHMFSADEGDWVILLDASLYESQRSLVQQKGNDLSLIRKRQSKILNRKFNDYGGENLSQGLLSLVNRGERKDVTIVLATILGFNFSNETISGEVVFSTLNSYVSIMMQPLVDEGGMVDKIRGDALTALFGIIPATGSAPAHALKAALRLIEAVKEAGKVRQADKSLTLDTGIGIASGSVALGVIGSQNEKTFIAAGYHVNLAERLGRQARPSEIMVDENTFNQLGKMQQYFSMTTMLEKGIVEPIRIFSYLVK